jgi:hypothetical protein
MGNRSPLFHSNVLFSTEENIFFFFHAHSLPPIEIWNIDGFPTMTLKKLMLVFRTAILQLQHFPGFHLSQNTAWRIKLNCHHLLSAGQINGEHVSRSHT